MSVFVTRNTDISAAAMQSLYASKLQLSFERFARSVTLERTNVTVKFGAPAQYIEAPAWSDDSQLTVVHPIDNGSILAAENIMRLKGLVIHELGHLVYTPRSKTDLAKYVHNDGLHNAFNILEDNRIENFMVSRMSGIAPWLIHTIGQEITKSIPVTDWLPLLWGRKYLPLDLRQHALASWKHNSGQEIADTIDQYITLNLNVAADVATAKQLIRNLNNLLGSVVKSANHGKHQSSAPTSDGSKPASKGEQDKVLKDVKKQLDQEATSNDDADSNVDGDTDSSADPQSSPDSAAGKAAQDIMSGLLQQAQDHVYEDIKSTIESIRGGDVSTEESSDIKKKHQRKVDKVPASYIKLSSPKPDFTSASRSFAKELNELRAMHDPGWVRKTDQGRINVRQFMLDADFDEMFDQWSDGNQDVTDIECVILLDNSGSMDRMIDDAYNSMWAIKRALDSINASTTVIQFGSHGSVLYPANVRANAKVATARYWGGGDTKPFQSLVRAKEILDNSQRAVKMLITITDGAWSNSDDCERIILGMRMSGVLTGLVFLAPSDGEGLWYVPKTNEGEHIIDGHKCEVVTLVNKPYDIIDFARSMTRLAQKKMANI